MSPTEILKKYYGYDNFREAQEQLINSILEGRDTLGIMPTGAGKSICYQVPALILQNITLVISPLISLMKDQVQALQQLGVPAAYINSTLPYEEVRYIQDLARQGRIKLIYVSPERLLTDGFINFVQTIKIDMLTVDEAHCISQWGQDFRPSYTAIPQFIERLSYRPIVSAFTATATSNVKNDIIAMLQQQEPKVIITGFDRPNLYFGLIKTNTEGKSWSLIEIVVNRIDESGIVYCSSRKNVEEVCNTLNSYGFKATHYHAGLSNDLRQRNQDDFLFDRVNIMVATNAFGMGIDKSNVSYVVHYDMPRDIESYYQEAGRSGRDGRESFCVILYTNSDVPKLKWLIDKKAEEVLEKDPTQAQVVTNLKEIEHQRLKAMETYCKTNDCLRYLMLRYFGENITGKCQKCSNCNPIKDTKIYDITEEARKIVSCIYRMGEIYDTKVVIDVLQGNKTQLVVEYELDKLTTYNISKTQTNFLVKVIEYLIKRNYVEKNGQALKLGENYKELLKKGVVVYAPIEVEQQQTQTGNGGKVKEEVQIKRTQKSELTQENLALYEKLKQLCRTIAQDEGVPQFYIFMDTTLLDMAKKSPTNSNEFIQVQGVSESKLIKYGEMFIKVIQENNNTRKQ